ncbi:MAG: argininosuccinate lyase [Bacteroidota bacterium]
MLWGGRFSEKLNSLALDFSSSFNIDKTIVIEDLMVSKVHAAMLSKVGLISPEESIQIIKGLEQIETEWNSDAWHPDSSVFEDIHSAVESRLYEIAGQVAGKLHTGRSRNDQVITGFRLWTKKGIAALTEIIKELQLTLVNTAKEHTETIISGYTHLQRAQPVSLAFHLLAYVEMLERDKKRLEFVLSETDKSPLGSGALAGSTLPLDRDFTCAGLGFAEPCRNALDAVSDRDFALDFLNCCAIGMMHLSRLAEELILWSTSEWSFIKLADSLTTGSSLMPQKKNPDMAELIRGKIGRVSGNYITLLTIIKGLPLSYNRDLQEDKEPVFDSFKTYFDSLQIMNMMIASVKVDTKKYEKELKGDFSLATDLADWIVLQGIPFRDAHSIVGKVVKYAEDNSKKLILLATSPSTKKIPLNNSSPEYSFFTTSALALISFLLQEYTPKDPNKTAPTNNKFFVFIVST